MIIKLGGEEVNVTKTHIEINIRSLFMSAGKIYNFTNNSPAISINKAILQFALKFKKKLLIRVKGGEGKEISPEDYLNLVHKYKSIYRTKGGMELYVYPVNEL